MLQGCPSWVSGNATTQKATGAPQVGRPADSLCARAARRLGPIAVTKTVLIWAEGKQEQEAVFHF